MNIMHSQGIICLFRCWQDETVRSNREAAITSIALRGAGHQVYTSSL